MRDNLLGLFAGFWIGVLCGGFWIGVLCGGLLIAAEPKPVEKPEVRSGDDFNDDTPFPSKTPTGISYIRFQLEFHADREDDPATDWDERIESYIEVESDTGAKREFHDPHTTAQFTNAHRTAMMELMTKIFQRASAWIPSK